MKKTSITVNTHTFTFKSFKTVKWMSEETLCFTAKLCLNGKAIGNAENNGHGGCTFVHFNTPELRQQFEAITYGFVQPKYGSVAEHIADSLCDLEMEAKADASLVKRIRKDCATGLVFLTDKDALKEGYRTYRTADLEKAKEAMQVKYGVIQVLNGLTDDELVNLSQCNHIG